MANYIASARSNYFRVKDLEAFKKALPSSVAMWTHNRQPEFIAICSDDADGGGWPSTVWSDEENDYVEVDLGHLLSDHLADGEVAILMEVGAEKLRYLVAYAIVIKAGEQPIHMNLEDMASNKARELWGITATEVCY